MNANEYDVRMLQKLSKEAEENERERRAEGDEKGAEYFRGVAAGFHCAAIIIEDKGE